MYDIKTIEFGQQQQQQHKSQQHQQHEKSLLTTTTITASTPTAAAEARVGAGAYCSSSSSSSISEKPQLPSPSLALASTSPSSLPSSLALPHCRNPSEYTHMTLLSLRRRRLLQRHTCLLSILAAFVFGLALGVFMPMFGLSNVFGTTTMTTHTSAAEAAAGGIDGGGGGGGSMHTLPIAEEERGGGGVGGLNRTRLALARPPSDFPTIYELRNGIATAAAAAPSAKEQPYSVAFIRERDEELPAQVALRDAFHVAQDRSAPDALLVQRLDASDGSVREFRMQRVAEGRFRKGPERRLAKLPQAPNTNTNTNANTNANTNSSSGSGSRSAIDDSGMALPAGETIEFVPLAQRIVQSARNARHHRGIIKANIYWGDAVERAMPPGFGRADSAAWNRYVSGAGVVARLEAGCGRMQNRMVVFADGTRACARYRQNTDQIQGELFSFYLGQLLNLSNLAPSAASVVDVERPTWAGALPDITQAQWKQQRPVVLTRWLPDLEPAGIPQPFRPLERHLNKYDVWNITLGGSGSGSAQTLTMDDALNVTSTSTATSSTVLQRLIELAQWSDLIVFDYLIANLDRVVNNLYNYQWNADIMAAPAHNLARRPDTQLLVFLDNESGLLHGYRLLKKYEAYHGLLLDNLCVFRQPTIEALRQLRAHGVGQRLRELFERTTSAALRDVLPTLPDKSVKILVDRIDRVLGQVQKCNDLLAADS